MMQYTKGFFTLTLLCHVFFGDSKPMDTTAIPPPLIPPSFDASKTPAIEIPVREARKWGMGRGGQGEARQRYLLSDVDIQGFLVMDEKELRRHFRIAGKDPKYVYLSLKDSHDKAKPIKQNTPQQKPRLGLDQDPTVAKDILPKLGPAKVMPKTRKLKSDGTIANSRNKSRSKRALFFKFWDAVSPKSVLKAAIPISLFHYLGYLPMRIPGVPYHIDPGSPDYSYYNPMHEIYVDQNYYKKKH